MKSFLFKLASPPQNQRSPHHFISQSPPPASSRIQSPPPSSSQTSSLISQNPPPPPLQQVVDESIRSTILKSVHEFSMNPHSHMLALDLNGLNEANARGVAEFVIRSITPSVKDRIHSLALLLSISNNNNNKQIVQLFFDSLSVVFPTSTSSSSRKGSSASAKRGQNQSLPVPPPQNPETIHSSEPINVEDDEDEEEEADEVQFLESSWKNLDSIHFGPYSLSSDSIQAVLPFLQNFRSISLNVQPLEETGIDSLSSFLSNLGAPLTSSSSSSSSSSLSERCRLENLELEGSVPQSKMATLLDSLANNPHIRSLRRLNIASNPVSIELLAPSFETLILSKPSLHFIDARGCGIPASKIFAFESIVSSTSSPSRKLEIFDSFPTRDIVNLMHDMINWRSVLRKIQGPVDSTSFSSFISSCAARSFFGQEDLVLAIDRKLEARKNRIVNSSKPLVIVLQGTEGGKQTFAKCLAAFLRAKYILQKKQRFNSSVGKRKERDQQEEADDDDEDANHMDREDSEIANLHAQFDRSASEDEIKEQRRMERQLLVEDFFLEKQEFFVFKSAASLSSGNLLLLSRSDPERPTVVFVDRAESIYNVEPLRKIVHSSGMQNVVIVLATSQNSSSIETHFPRDLVDIFYTFKKNQERDFSRIAQSMIDRTRVEYLQKGFSIGFSDSVPKHWIDLCDGNTKKLANVFRNFMEMKLLPELNDCIERKFKHCVPNSGFVVFVHYKATSPTTSAEGDYVLESDCVPDLTSVFEKKAATPIINNKHEQEEQQQHIHDLPVLSVPSVPSAPPIPEIDKKIAINVDEIEEEEAQESNSKKLRTEEPEQAQEPEKEQEKEQEKEEEEEEEEEEDNKPLPWWKRLF